MGANRYAELAGNGKKYRIKSRYGNKTMVYDMLIERGNDGEKYDLKGQPGTLKDFFRGGGRIGG